MSEAATASPLATFEVVSLFPDMFRSVLGASLLGKAIETGRIAVHLTDPRDFAPGKHRSTDDAPYGGGSGMVMRPEPLVAALEHLEAARGPAWKVILTPRGPRLDQARVRALAARPRIALVCGRYEGIDERVHELVDEELSLGDFVLSGGELAAMTLIDAVSRLHEGVLGNESSIVDESFEHGLLEYPQYTRPPEFRGAPVPEVLLSGDHAKIRRWRRQQSLAMTRVRRPDLYARHRVTDEDRALVAEAPGVEARTFVALVHHPVYDRERQIVTSAITNLDLHDIARSSRTYGLAGYLVVTPIEAQRALADSILATWKAAEGLPPPRSSAERSARRRAAQHDLRREALSRVAVVESLDAARAFVEQSTGQAPVVVATSARPSERLAPTPFDAFRADAERDPRPVLLLLGTGWGLADEVLDRVDRLLSPIRAAGRGVSDYNHLSVRSAAAIVLDRLFGDR